MAEGSVLGGRLRAVEQLKNAEDLKTQLDILKSVKNDLIGHESRKVQYITAGILPTLSTILAQDVYQPKPVFRNVQPSQRVCVEAANIVCLIAHEGPAFVQPILESNLPAKLCAGLNSKTSPREKLAILRCLNAIADDLPPWAPGKWSQDARFADLLYTSENIASLVDGINSAKHTFISQQICDGTIALICKTCRTERQKRALVEQGCLHVLSERLASFIVAEGLVIPNTEVHLEAGRSLPEPAPAYAHMSPVLEAISVLIEESKERAELFLAAPALSFVLPMPQDAFSPSDMKQAPWGSSYFSGTAIPKSRTRDAFDGLIPVLLASEKTSSPSHLNFPPLGSGGPTPKRRSSFHPTATNTTSIGITNDMQDEREEFPVVPWLLFIAREARNRRRLLASKLLVTLHSLKFIPASRAQTFSGLLVPILARMLDQDDQDVDDQIRPPNSQLSNGTHYSRAAPAVLALLIMDDPDLQKVAVDSKAIVKLSAGLRRTFEEPLGRKPSPWRPFKATKSDVLPSSPETSLGPGGPSASMRDDMTFREGTLQALAAIAPFNDDYRKQICDQGILTQIMLALEPFQVQENTASKCLHDSTGNSASTILAACGAVRALTRSVTALRTKLVDAEVAKSIIKLMSNADPEVRIAATKVLANLAMYLSPMKDSVGDRAVVKKLCEQAHSANARLRLESIWALKQLVVNASKKLKQEIINELGSSWIKLLIKTDPYDIPNGEVIGLVDREYPPRSNYPPATVSDDVVMSEDSDGDQPGRASNASPGHVGEADDSFSRRVPEDDLAIQEQVLDLIRNLFCGDNASDIVDYVLGEIGKDDFFKILLTRLRPRTLSGATRKENQTTPVSVGIVTKVLYIIVHIAACSHKWRSAVAKEQTLLKQVLTFSTHSERAVRAQCCWLAINLMYEDEVSDRTSCKQRAMELQKIGFFSHLRKLENDADLDVRERAKTAVHLMTSLITS